MSMEVPVAETFDCQRCGDTILTYDHDGELIEEILDWCRHLDICRDCEQNIDRIVGDQHRGSGCEECEREREEDRKEAMAEDYWRDRRGY